MSDDLRALRDDLAAMVGPGLAKALPQSVRERADDLSTAAFGAGFNASRMPEAALARRLNVCTRMVRDWRSGARSVPMYAILGLPRDGAVAALRMLAAGVPEQDEQKESA